MESICLNSCKKINSAIETIFSLFQILVILSIIIIVFADFKLAFCGEVGEYAGLLEGLQRNYQIIQKEDNVEVARGIIRTSILSKKKINQKDVTPVQVSNESISFNNKMRITFVDYMLLSSETLILVATKYPDETEIHQMNKILLKAPLDIGSIWVTGAYEKIVESKNDTVKVPIGFFTNCLRIKTTRKIDGQLVYEETAWYAAELGQVKSIAKYPQENSEIDIQLLTVGKHYRNDPKQGKQ